jgi:hypothetical protein
MINNQLILMMIKTMGIIESDVDRGVVFCLLGNKKRG